jgi:hypothetical protein
MYHHAGNNDDDAGGVVPHTGWLPYECRRQSYWDHALLFWPQPKFRAIELDFNITITVTVSGSFLRIITLADKDQETPVDAATAEFKQIGGGVDADDYDEDDDNDDDDADYPAVWFWARDYGNVLPPPGEPNTWQRVTAWFTAVLLGGGDDGGDKQQQQQQQ